MTSRFEGDLNAMHAELRSRLTQRLQRRLGSTVKSGDVALFAGGSQVYRYDTDHECLFRQESNFHYLFGVNEPELFSALRIDTGETYLFIPRLGLDHAIWCGDVHSPSEFAEKYGIEHVNFVDELEQVLCELGTTTIHFLEGVNSDSRHAIEPIQFEGQEKFEMRGDILYNEIVECRVVKSAAELVLLRHLNELSSRAHVTVMQRCRPKMFEYQLESIFKSETSFYGNSRLVAYTCICGTGNNGAILHYGHAGAPNERQFNEHDMCLLDMGAEFHAYASDITCSFPANGIFTEDQRQIYTTVLRALRAVEAAIKPGVEWVDLHCLALRVIGESLLEFNFLKGTIDELLDKHVPALFMPHGLGHLMGKDTHDPGGYPEGRLRAEAPSVCNLRCNRILTENMVITNEPGVYFIKALLLPALEAQQTRNFFNRDKIMRFMNFGGVRLEDDIIITSTGCENMTKVPRAIDDVERVMSGGEWQF